MVCGVQISAGEKWPVITRLTAKRARFAKGEQLVVITAPPCHAIDQKVSTTGGLRPTRQFRHSETTVAVEVVLRSSGTVTVRSTTGTRILQLLTR